MMVPFGLAQLVGAATVAVAERPEVSLTVLLPFSSVIHFVELLFAYKT